MFRAEQPHMRKSKLITLTGGALERAPHFFGKRMENKTYRKCLMVMIPDRVPFKCWMSIPEGFHALVTEHGQYIGRWPAGFNCAKPWVRVSHLVSMQYVVFETPVQECPTLDNVMVEIDVSVVLSVMDNEQKVKDFVYRLGPERLQEMLKAYQEEAVRGMARQKKYTDIYDLMDTGELPSFEEKADGLPVGELEPEAATFEDDEGDEDGEDQKTDPKEEKTRGRTASTDENLREQLENTKAEMNGKLEQYGIKVYSITITSVRLPEEFTNQMEEATTFQSKNIEQESKQKYDLMVIENQEARNKASQALLEAKEEAVVKKDQRAATETKITEVFKAETNSIIAVIKEEMKAEIRDINTNSELAVAQMNAEKEEELAAIAASADSEIELINAELEGFIMNTQAEAKMKVAELKAQEEMMHAKAELLMSKKLISKRDFDAKMANLLTISGLAQNRNAVVVGTVPKDRDGTIATLVGAKNAGISLNLNN